MPRRRLPALLIISINNNLCFAAHDVCGNTRVACAADSDGRRTQPALQQDCSMASVERPSMCRQPVPYTATLTLAGSATPSDGPGAMRGSSMVPYCQCPPSRLGWADCHEGGVHVCSAGTPAPPAGCCRARPLLALEGTRRWSRHRGMGPGEWAGCEGASPPRTQWREAIGSQAHARPRCVRAIRVRAGRWGPTGWEGS
jgi:hypothetical protein